MDWLVTTPTIPAYTLCKNHPPVDYKWEKLHFVCEDLRTGQVIPCSLEAKLTFEGGDVETTGGHLHDRLSTPNFLASMGGLWFAFMGEGAAPQLRAEGNIGYFAGQGKVFIPEASGAIWIRARLTALDERYVCVGGGGFVPMPSQPRTCWGGFQVKVKIDKLEPMPAQSPYYILLSNPGPHVAEVFNGTLPFLVSMVEFAQNYQKMYAKKYAGNIVRVSINDLSLPLGGLYDFTGNWDCPHSWHRLGTSADVNRYHADGTDVDQDLIEDAAEQTKKLRRNQREKPLIHFDYIGGNP